jgi:Short C-terminal domain/Phospholipase_D-nuclease N-terminal
MVVAATFWDFLWSLIIIFFMVWFFIILFQVIVDLFRRDDAGAGKKILWLLFLILAPFVGLLIYLLVNHDGMMERSTKQAQKAQEQYDDYVRSVAGSGNAADQIEKAKTLLDNGTISQQEFDSIKAKALS